MKSRSSHRAPSGRRTSSKSHRDSSSTTRSAQSTIGTDLLISQTEQALAALQAGTTTFTLFSTMPAEMRLKVWGHTFESKEAVCIEHNVYKSDVNDDSTKAFIEENKRLLPVALFVNKESRDHALGCHTIIHRDEIAAPIKYAGLRPLCAKASDVFWVEFITMMNCPDELHDWISAIKTNHAGFIDSITKLEVRGTFSEFFFPRVLNDNKNTCQSSAEIDPSRKMICGSVLLFPALKEITFTGKDDDKDWVTPLGRLQLEQLKAWIVAFLEQLKPLFNGGAAPKVTFRPFKTFQQLMDG
ncbi:hypothetical protein IFR04_013132 [Cadophora malorum]|uniref:2EXR domain-containing protein n=1 Tax=Cadophora malorum TaxID=108018 RepID=A0A8H7T5Y6_9HELO|nr:hypothetical protein IFR04_013132 [Cadophora malorum]